MASPEAIITPASSRSILKARFLPPKDISFTPPIVSEINGRQAEWFRLRTGYSVIRKKPAPHFMRGGHRKKSSRPNPLSLLPRWHGARPVLPADRRRRHRARPRRWRY